ncbi:MAG: arylsulfatase [Fuerstiella sp.]|nr:arylsulfatase [Fuerstiella sp.]
MKNLITTLLCVTLRIVQPWCNGSRQGFRPTMPKLLASSATIFLTLVTNSAHAARQPDRPNIIFILADDMGYGDLGCYGAEKIKTPNIDRLATGGILFTDGHCGASTCTPTRYGLMTGQHAWRSWCKYSALSTNAPLLIDEDRATIASFLKSAGYSTSIVGKWHLGYGREEGFADNRGDLAPNFWDTRGNGPNWNGELKPGPRENGFDYSYVVPVANSFPPYVFIENYRVAGLRKESPIGKLESRNHGKMEGGEGARWRDEELIDKFADKLVSQLERLAGEQKERSGTRQEFRHQNDSSPKALAASATDQKPFFLYYTPTQPHIGSRVVKRNSHWPNERFQGTSEAGNYGDVVQELDWSVGEILDTLDRLGIAENTLVIFASDNGGYTRNFNGHQPNGHILRGGKGDLVEGGHRVPFLAKWPGKIKPGTRSKETISTTDMLATVAAIIGKDLPAGAGPDSYNVLPALLGKTLPHPERPVVLSSGGTGTISIRAGKWKLIDGQGNCGYGEFRNKQPWPVPKPGAPPAQLYNLDEDLGEANNLYTQHPGIVHRLKVGLEKIKADENYNPTALEQPKEKLSIEQLNALFPKPQANLRSGTRRESRSPANPKVLVSSTTSTLTKIGG